MCPVLITRSASLTCVAFHKDSVLLCWSSSRLSALLEGVGRGYCRCWQHMQRDQCISSKKACFGALPGENITSCARLLCCASKDTVSAGSICNEIGVHTLNSVGHSLVESFNHIWRKTNAPRSPRLHSSAPVLRGSMQLCSRKIRDKIIILSAGPITRSRCCYHLGGKPVGTPLLSPRPPKEQEGLRFVELQSSECEGFPGALLEAGVAVTQQS